VSSRVRAEAPHSVNLLRWDPTQENGQCRIERWDYAAQAGAFLHADTFSISSVHRNIR
jgi:hypothetical protein